MTSLFNVSSYRLLLGLTIGLFFTGNLNLKAQELYQPILIPSNEEIADVLTDQDIPTGEGGFSRDYRVKLNQGDQVVIDLISEDFDTKVTLIGADGTTIAENDDGPDGTTNSLLFVRIVEAEEYIVRVSAFGDTGGGRFTLKVTRLKPVDQ